MSAGKKPERTTLNLRKLQHVAGRALQNGIALHFDSILLHNNRSYGSALFLSVIAMEEIGKAFSADHYAWSTAVHSRSDEEFEHDWINALLGDHRSKQLNFLRQDHSSWNTAFHQQVASKQLESLKQNSIYVGLSKPKAGQPRTEGRIISPRQIGIARSRKQLGMVHRFLLEEISGIERGSIHHDLAVFRSTLTRSLRERLEQAEI